MSTADILPGVRLQCTAALCSRRSQRLALWVLEQFLLKSANRAMFFHGCVTTRISDVQRQRCVCLEPRYRHYSQHYSYRIRQVIYE